MFTSPLIRSLLGVAALLLSSSLARAEFGGLRDNGAFFPSRPRRKPAGTSEKLASASKKIS